MKRITSAIDKIDGINNIKIIQLKGISHEAYQVWGTNFALDRAQDILRAARINFELRSTPVGKCLNIIYRKDKSHG